LIVLIRFNRPLTHIRIDDMVHQFTSFPARPYR